jgi:hypothetical protein
MLKYGRVRINRGDAGVKSAIRTNVHTNKIVGLRIEHPVDFPGVGIEREQAMAVHNEGAIGRQDKAAGRHVERQIELPADFSCSDIDDTNHAAEGAPCSGRDPDLALFADSKSEKLVFVGNLKSPTQFPGRAINGQEFAIGGGQGGSVAGDDDRMEIEIILGKVPDALPRPRIDGNDLAVGPGDEEPAIGG